MIVISRMASGACRADRVNRGTPEECRVQVVVSRDTA